MRKRSRKRNIPVSPTWPRRGNPERRGSVTRAPSPRWLDLNPTPLPFGLAANDLGTACALLAPLAWSFAVIFYKRASGLPPMSMNLFKNSIAIVLLLLTMLAFGLGVPAERSTLDWARLVGSGVIGLAVGDTLLFAGLARIGAARLAVVDTFYAPLVVFMAWAFLGESLGGAFLGGASLVIAGIALANVRFSWGGGLHPPQRPPRAAPQTRFARPGPRSAPASHDAGDAAGASLHRSEALAQPADPSEASAHEADSARDAELLKGVLLSLAAITCTCIGVVLAKPALASGNLVEITCTRLVAGTVAQLLWTAARGSWAESGEAFVRRELWRHLVPGALVGTYLSLLLWLGGFKWGNASVAAVLNQMATVYMLVLARVLLGETLRPAQVAGGLLAASGALWIVLAR